MSYGNPEQRFGNALADALIGITSGSKRLFRVYRDETIELVVVLLDSI